ncbi:Transcription factor ILR3, partial [Mucuna pruriens]
MNNNNWVLDYDYLDNIPLPTLDTPNFSWSSSPPPTLSVELDDSFGNSDGFKENGSRKRFMELGSLLDPRRPLKLDKVVLLSDAVRMLSHLREETHKLRESTQNLQQKINELKAEKNELRDEKQRLKAEKDNLEQKLKAFLPAFPAQGQVLANKLVPFMGYPGVATWQFLPPAAVDTSQDH